MQADDKQHYLSIVLALAASDVYHSDADGFNYCGVCGSSQEYAGMIQHEGDCAYLRALAVRQALADENDKEWTARHA